MIAPPPCPRMTGIAYLQPRKVEPVLTFIMVIHSSMVISSTLLRILMPALLTSTSTPPPFCTAKSTAFFQSSSLVTSAAKNQAAPPAAFNSADSASPVSRADSRSRIKTFAPFFAQKPRHRAAEAACAAGYENRLVFDVHAGSPFFPI